MVDYIADYIESIRKRRVFPDKKPGFLREQIPESAPVDGEKWPKIFKDIEDVIMPGVTHWQSPHMHGYFPALNSFPSLLGDMLADGINCIGFTWVTYHKNKPKSSRKTHRENLLQASSPACTELETIVMNWLGKMIGLPDEFLHTKPNASGGGVIQVNFSFILIIQYSTYFACTKLAQTDYTHIVTPLDMVDLKWLVF